MVARVASTYLVDDQNPVGYAQVMYENITGSEATSLGLAYICVRLEADAGTAAISDREQLHADDLSRVRRASEKAVETIAGYQAPGVSQTCYLLLGLMPHQFPWYRPDLVYFWERPLWAVFVPWERFKSLRSLYSI